LWVEGSPELARAARDAFAQHVSRGQLQVVHSIVTPENVNDIVAGARLPATVDFVSIDIDRHTHSIWEALGVKARVHCIEYNGSIPPSLD